MKRAFLSVLFLSLTWSGALQAEPVIRAIDVKGNQMVSADAVRSTIESRVGMTYSAERIRRDIAALIRSGNFGDVKVERQSASSGLRLVYLVSERSRVTKYSFEGNKKVKEEKLREIAGPSASSLSDPTRLQHVVDKIRQHYISEGYYLADISPETKSLPGSNDREMVFRIREGEGVRIRKVNIIGNKAFSDGAIRKLFKSREKGYFSWLNSSGKYQEELLKRDTAFLAYHYQSEGYLKVQVTAPKVYLSRDKKWLTLTFHVQEGEKYHIRNVGIEGDILTTQEELISKLKARPKALYNRKDVEQDLTLISSLYGDQGYAFANIQPAIIPHDEDRTADVIYHVRKGGKVYIERINVAGNTTTRDKVIRRELLVKENTLYNETRLRQSKERIEALGYFQEVNFATPRGSADNRIIVNIAVKEKPTGTFSLGAGFSSVEHFIFTASIAKDNFLGYGVSGQFSTELSSKRQLFILSLEDPYFLDSNWILGVSGYRTVNVFTDFDRKSFGGSLSLGHRIFESSTFRLGYQAESVDVSDFRTTVPALFTQNLSGFTSSMSVGLQRDTRNNRLFPTRGMYQSFTSEFAGLGGDNEFIRLTENFRYYQPIWKGLVGKVNFTMAQISSLNNRPVPLFERYFLGGVNSLRGYELRSIGPAVRMPNSPQGGDNRFVYGGNKMLQLNAELEFPIYDPAGFKAVTFVDLGNAFAEDENFSVKDLRADYGVGLRWNSPLGPLRFEWGFPFKRNAGEEPVIFNFTIGSFF